MRYFSTGLGTEYRPHSGGLTYSAKEAIISGLAEDGGLFMPVELPQLPQSVCTAPENFGFHDLAIRAAEIFLGEEIPEADLGEIIRSAFDFPLPLLRVGEGRFVLELFHGPTLAFKDFGARFLSRALSYFRRNENRELTILVATSGDTGSAVASGFYRVPGIRVVILYPSGRVSRLQEQQLTTHGENITALEVQGSFDDCQRLVKSAFVDRDLARRLELSSANSINIARLIPQSFYYLHLVAELKRQTGAAPGEAVVSVPSGNFGNLCAGLFAKKMGIGPRRFVAATNANSVVVDYLRGGDFAPRASIATISNAMDVGNPSNFARLLSLYQGRREALAADVAGFTISEDETRDCILKVHEHHGYALDPHGAVGFASLEKYLAQQSDRSRAPGVVLATAHPAKFLDTMESLLPGVVELPPALADVLKKPKRAQAVSSRFDDFKQMLCELH